MELRQLKYFVRVVELGSVSRAAKDLYIAQPALSAQIINLEKELDSRLLSRSVRGVQPTEAGESLYLHAQTVLRQIERLRQDVRGTRPSGPVSIGLPTSAANILAGPLIAAVEATYPGIRLRIVESLSGHLRELVATGRIELSLLFEPCPDGNTDPPGREANQGALQWTPLLDEELFVMHAAHAANGKHGKCGKRDNHGKPGESDKRNESSITLRQTAGMRLVLPSRANSTRILIDQAFSAVGLPTTLMAEIDSLSTIQSIVASGQAATILSLSAFVGPKVLDDLSVLHLSDVNLRRRLSLCSSDVVGLSMAAEKVTELIPVLISELVGNSTWIGATLVRPSSSIP